MISVGLQCGSFLPDRALYKGRRMTLDVRILYTEGCANTPQTVQRVQDVARELRIKIEVDKVLVTTQEQANKLHFLGSPTVQINSLDIDPAARTATSFGFT